MDFKAPDWSHRAVTGHHTLFHSLTVWSYNLPAHHSSLNSAFSVGFFHSQVASLLNFSRNTLQCFVLRDVTALLIFDPAAVLSGHETSIHTHTLNEIFLQEHVLLMQDWKIVQKGSGSLSVRTCGAREESSPHQACSQKVC